MTLQQLTKEFAEHFQIIRKAKKVGNNPFGLRQLLVEDDPQLCASIRELYLDWNLLHELQAWWRQRDWPDIYPQFSKNYSEFRERWKDEFLALLRRKYDQIFSDESLFQWFVRLASCCAGLEVLRGHPYDRAVLRIERVTRDLQRPELADLFCDPEHVERLPGLGGFYVNFDALRETEEEAKRQAEEAARRKAEEAAKPEYEKAITRLHATMWDPDQGPGDEDDWFFDPQRHSAAELISALAGYCNDRGGDLPLWQRCAGAFDWLRDTVGLDLREIETRWHQIAPISVPRDVSESYEVDHPKSLFGYLNQVRLAYMIGADLAAIALCRTITEILVQYHYPSDQKIKNDLPGLIRSVQNQPKFGFLRKLNLTKKVRQANDILHVSSFGSSTVDTLPHQNWARGLAEDWVKALDEMISNAPAHGSAAKAP